MAGKRGIAVIGAGSPLFTPDLMASLLAAEELYGSTVRLHDIDPERLGFMARYARAFAEAHGGVYEVERCDNREEALSGADYVLSTVAVGSMAMRRLDVDIPGKYGVVHIKGDTTGPAGIFRGLRTVPFMLGLAEDMRRLCPKALLINLSNPMSVATRAVTGYSPIRTVGACSAVDGMRHDIAGKLALDPERLAIYCYGLNHFTWMAAITLDGRDFTEEFERRALPQFLEGLPVTRSLWAAYGCFPVPGFKYASEFYPWFLGPKTDFGRDLGFTPVDFDTRARAADASYAELGRRLACGDFPVGRNNLDTELIVRVILSAALCKPGICTLNVPNAGQLPGLPPGAVVEGPVLVAGDSFLPLCCPELPKAVMRQVARASAEQELVVRAAVEGSRDLLLEAMLMDPLVSSPEAAVAIVNELLELEKESLPQFRR